MATELPRRYLDETKDVILQRMLNNSPKDIDKRQGTVTWDTLSPASIELERLYIELDNVLQFGFVNENQPREYLELRCKEIGITLKPALKAKGTVTFYGDDGTVVPQGTRVYTDEETPVYFVTTEQGTVTNGQVTVSAEALEGGTKGNVPAGAITLHVGNIVGVASVGNSEPFEGGTDVETDESLLKRFFEKTQRPAISGNVWHYRQWALEVPGVSDCKVIPLWNGNGTVKVILLSDEKRSPSQTVIDNVITHIEQNRPIGADVTVEGATEVPINISATLILTEGKTLVDAQTEIEAGVTEYLKTLAYVDPIVRYTRIANVILGAPSVLDYSDLLINGSNGNIEIQDGDVAVLGAVNLDGQT